MEDGRLVIVVVDDHALFSRGLELLLNTTSDGRLFVAGRTESAKEALDLVRRHRPDVAVIDLAMPPPGGVAAIREVKHHYPKVRVLALSGTDDVKLALEALAAGADGFIPKSSDPEVLGPPLQAIGSGLSVLPSSLLAALVGSAARSGRGALDRLTADELALWRNVARGLESTEIAERLYVSERTAKRMVASLLRKIGAANRVEAAALAGRAGLLDDIPDTSTV